ncbi:MAG TPA: GNAT family N-acetyltransferase, partial [Pilimelia sp.]|nr:GNAT family N-acetyltransferase [Pilimelia sp.]
MALLLTAAPAGTTGYTLLLADDADQITAAQRLRHRVFVDELGAAPRTATGGLDADEFDEYCDHLIVRADATGEVVGTYRVLPPKRAARAGRRYADGEFELAALDPLRDHLVEVGRSCVHPDHRSGAVINLIWTGLARYLHLNGYRWLGGCASVPVRDDLAGAAAVWERVRTRHRGPPAMRVRPRRPWRAEPGVAAAGEAVGSAGGTDGAER